MILVCVHQFWLVHHRIFSGTSSRSSGSFLLTERRSGKASRKGATFPSRHNAQSMPYGGSPAFFASDNKLDFCSLFYTICIFASSRSSDIIGISFCHSKGGESMYRRVFPVIDPVATGGSKHTDQLPPSGWSCQQRVYRSTSYTDQDLRNTSSSLQSGYPYEVTP